MNPMPDLESLLQRALDKGVFGTKMRSVIKNADPVGVAEVVDQQFEVARTIVSAGLVPIIEPEIDIHSPTKAEAEELPADSDRAVARRARRRRLGHAEADPAVDPDFYRPLIEHPRVLRVVALSAGTPASRPTRSWPRTTGWWRVSAAPSPRDRRPR